MLNVTDHILKVLDKLADAAKAVPDERCEVRYLSNQAEECGSLISDACDLLNELLPKEERRSI